VDRGRLQADHATIQAAAAAIGRAGRQFLFARLAVHEILARPELLTDVGLADLITGDYQQLLAAAVRRLKVDRAVNGRLLQALAYSRGRGLPMCDGIWSAVASQRNGGSPVGLRRRRAWRSALGQW